jgi:hypothetical protein
MQMVFVLEVRVDAWLAAGGRVEVPRPAACPSCGCRRVSFDGWYPRHTRWGRVAIQRVLCADEGCEKRSHSLLPDVLVSGRVDLATVIGWALEAKVAGMGHRSIAQQLSVPAATVRGWLRRAASRGGRVAARLMQVARAAEPAGRDPPAGDGIATLVGAAVLAAKAWSDLSGEPVEPWHFAVAHTTGRLLG